MGSHLWTQMIRLSEVEHMKALEVCVPRTFLIESLYKAIGRSGTMTKNQIISTLNPLAYGIVCRAYSCTINVFPVLWHK